MSENVRIQISLKDGTVNLEAPVEALETVFSKLESFLPKLLGVKNVLDSEDKDAKPSSTAQENNHIEKELPIKESEKEEKKNESKGQQKKKKLETYKAVDLGLNEEQRNLFRTFYEAKKPSSQNQHILAVMYWLIKEAKKDSLSKEDIFTGLKTVQARIPARISSVLSNLIIDGKVVAEGGKYILHHTGEDYVNYDMLSKNEEKSKK